MDLVWSKCLGLGGDVQMSLGLQVWRKPRRSLQTYVILVNYISVYDPQRTRSILRSLLLEESH